MSDAAYHEPPELLSDDTRAMHRALVSLREELDAVDWYEQRAEACLDAELRDVLVHNKNEEVEHAMMLLEWIRRHSPTFDANAAKYLRSTGPITQVGSERSDGTSIEAGSSLGIGSLKERT
jgi:ferritin-like protein